VRAEIVAVGTELLLGQIANTNAQWMSERLAGIGINVVFHTVVGDNVPRIEEVLRGALGRVDVVLVTGGLGPTGDDLTRDAIAVVLGVPLVRHPELETMLRERFASFGRPMPENNLQQADVPEGARYLLPQLGSAPGLAAELPEGTRLFAMAGVPAEMREMMEREVLPELAALAGPAIVRSRVVRCTGVGESAVAAALEDLFAAGRNPTIAYLAGGGEVKVRLTAKAASPEEADALLSPLTALVVERLGETVFTTHDEALEDVVARLLRARGMTVACAESLTGGRLAARLTSAPGSSTTFKGSAVVYTPEAKREVLGVRQATIDEHGVVSEACALEMAAGARLLFGADVAVSVTGAAGPEPHDGAAPGTVWLALDAGDDGAQAVNLRAPGDRELVTRWTEQAALDFLRRHLMIGFRFRRGPSASMTRAPEAET
jgi:competence/damage-inducible protein CinA-like protein